MTTAEPRPAVRPSVLPSHDPAAIDPARSARGGRSRRRHRSPGRAVTAAVLRRALDRLPLRVRSAGGTTAGLGGPLLEIHDPKAFYGRIGASGLIGFGESYMAGEWDAPDLVGRPHRARRQRGRR